MKPTELYEIVDKEIRPLLEELKLLFLHNGIKLAVHAYGGDSPYCVDNHVPVAMYQLVKPRMVLGDVVYCHIHIPLEQTNFVPYHSNWKNDPAPDYKVTQKQWTIEVHPTVQSTTTEVKSIATNWAARTRFPPQHIQVKADQKLWVNDGHDRRW